MWADVNDTELHQARESANRAAIEAMQALTDWLIAQRLERKPRRPRGLEGVP